MRLRYHQPIPNFYNQENPHHPNGTISDELLDEFTDIAIASRFAGLSFSKLSDEFKREWDIDWDNIIILKYLMSEDILKMEPSDEKCRLMDEEFPGSILLCEANMWPKEVRPYFADGDEFQLGFHFPLMPRIYMSLGKQNASCLVKILKDTPDIPENCQWCTFLRNHDELTLEMVTEEDRQWMWNFYAPDREMRKNLGIRRRLWPLLDNDPKKVALAYSMMLTMPGSPVFYYGDEIGMGDDIRLFDRNGVRTLMQWDDSKNGGFSTADKTCMPVIDDPVYGYKRVNVAAQEKDPGSHLNMIRSLMMTRKASDALCRGKFEWLIDDDENVPVLAYIRETEYDKVWVLQNMTDEEQQFTLDLPEGSYTDLNHPEFELSVGKNTTVSIEPRGFYWIHKK